MSTQRSFLVLPFLILASLTLLSAQGEAASQPPDQIELKLDTSEAEAVLSILDKRGSGSTVTDADWQRVFKTEPYVRLKKREAAMHRDFTDDDFRKFVLTPELGAKASTLRQTLDAWKHANLDVSAKRVLAFLPQQAVIRAKVFPVIKPKTNSFVFESATDPAIFLYLDPAQSAAKFENTVAHELHHIGYSSIGSLADTKQKDAAPTVKPALEWMGAFGEGFAMLAAAGGPDADPHATSSTEEHARWDHDLANFNNDLNSLQEFFLDIVDQRFTGKEKIDEKAYTFFGDAQGPWYTVGYKMAVVIEKRFGRKVLIDCMLDPRELLSRYNQAANESNPSGQQKLATWSPELMAKISMRLADSSHNPPKQ